MLSDIEYVTQILEEDHWRSDLTSRAVKSYFARAGKALPAKREFIVFAKSNGVFSGTAFVRALAEVAQFEPHFVVKEGEEFESQSVLLVGAACPLDILSFERSLLNGLQLLCATATETAKLVDRVEELCVEKKIQNVPGIYHTRKSIPLMRNFQLQAVVAGGGNLHRRHLEERILLKENHKYLALESQLSFEGLIEEALKSDPLAMIEVETPKEAFTVCSLGAKHIMLDNFSSEQICETLKFLKGRVEIEVSGGITIEALNLYLYEGISRISTSAMTMRAGALDLSLDWKTL